MRTKIMNRKQISAYHLKAAEHHKRAAEHHLEAAKHYETNNHEQAHLSAYLAHSHTRCATENAINASKCCAEIECEQS